MRIPPKIVESLLQLEQGMQLPESSARHRIIDELIAEGIILKSGRIQKKLTLTKKEALRTFLKSKYGIQNLAGYLRALSEEDIQRSNLIDASSDSKLKPIRTFKGFLVNCYEPVTALLNGQSIILNPLEGTFHFIYDYENFFPERDITIVGVENAENFRFILEQRYLFEKIKPLFVSRYPQQQHKDLIRWLQMIPNNYLHFGDYDLAGIGIYLNEFQKYLGNRASFFVPENILFLLEKYGNRKRYNVQKENFDLSKIDDPELKELVRIIHFYRKGLDQEILIAKNFVSQ